MLIAFSRKANGRKQRGTKEPLEGERGEWKTLT